MHKINHVNLAQKFRLKYMITRVEPTTPIVKINLKLRC